MPQLVYGQERPILRDDNSFLEGFKFDPLSLFEAFKFPNPFISNVNPSTGDISGGTFVSLTGSGFFQLSRLRIATTPVAFNFVDDKHVTFTTPSHAIGAVDIDVLTPGGSFTDPGSFTYATTGPIISSLSISQGDQLGGEIIPINGVGFTGATSVTVGGASAAFSVISDILVLARAPTGTAGAADVVVTTPGGPSTGGTGLWTYWDPSLLTLTLFVERGSYLLGNVADGANANISKWTGRASLGTSASHTFICGAAATTAPFEDNFEPLFDGTDDELSSLAAFIDTDIWTNGAGTVVVGFNAAVADAQAAAGQAYTDPCLILNDGGGVCMACSYSDAGWRPTAYDGAWQDAFAVPAAINKEHVGQFKWDGVNGHSRVGLGAFTSAPLGSIAAFPGANVAMGRAFAGGPYFNGRTRFIVTAQTALSDADCDKIVTWAQNRHGMVPNAGVQPELWYLLTDVFDPTSQDAMTIKGRQLTGANAVYFANGSNVYACVNVGSTDDNTLVFNPPVVPAGVYSVIVENAGTWTSMTNAVEAFTPTSLTTEAIWDVANGVVNGILEATPVITSIPNTGTVVDGGSRDLNLTTGTTGSGYPTKQTFSFNNKPSFGNDNITVDEVRNLKTGAFTTPVAFAASPQALRVYQVFYLATGGFGHNVYLRLAAGGSSGSDPSLFVIPGGSASCDDGSTGLNTATPATAVPVTSCCVYSDNATIGSVQFGHYFTKDAAGVIDITTNPNWNDMFTGCFPAEGSQYHQTIIIATKDTVADGYALTAEKRKVMKWCKHFYATAVSS